MSTKTTERARATERRVREIAAAAWVHHHVESGPAGGGRTAVTVMATVSHMRGMTNVVRVVHRRPGTAWRMALTRLERVADAQARRQLHDADRLVSDAAALRHGAAAVFDALLREG